MNRTIGESGEVADHAPAQGDEEGLAVETGPEHLAANPGGAFHALGGLACGHGDAHGLDDCLAQGGFEVVCQALLGPQQLVRVVKDSGKCYRETMSRRR